MSHSASKTIRIDRSTLRAVGSSELLGRIWNCWTASARGNRWGGFDHTTHAMELTKSGHAPDRTLCGIRWTGETGMVTLKDDPAWQPGCNNCLKQLIKRGILRPNDPDQR